MARDRFFVLKCVIFFYIGLALILAALAGFGAILIFMSGRIWLALCNFLSAAILAFFALLGYCGVAKKNRCELISFGVYLSVTFIMTIIILVVLPGNFQEIREFQATIMNQFDIHDESQLKFVKIVLGIEAVIRMITAISSYWLAHIVKENQRRAARNMNTEDAIL